MFCKFGRVVDDVMYGICCNGKVFWYYMDELVYVFFIVWEFIDFEVVYLVEYFLYYNDYYLV